MTTPGLKGEPVEAFAEREFRELQIGSKDLDNGLLFVIAPNDHKMKLEVGYGLEGDIPDVIAKRILDDEIRPYFRQNKFFDGSIQLIQVLQRKSYELPQNISQEEGFWTSESIGQVYLTCLLLHIAMALVLVKQISTGPIEDRDAMLAIAKSDRPPGLQFALKKERNYQISLYLISFVYFGALVLHFLSFFPFGLVGRTSQIFLILGLGILVALLNRRFSDIYPWTRFEKEATPDQLNLIKIRYFKYAAGRNSKDAGATSEGPSTFWGSGGDGGASGGGFSDGGMSGGGGASSDW